MSIRIDGTNTTANPGITGSDADTGLQFGTDEVSIVTAGEEQVKVDSSGRVGIGTSSPSQILELKAAEPRICLNGTTGDAFKGIEFDHNGTRYGSIFHNQGDGDLTISSGDNGSGYFINFKTDNAERMRIHSGGEITKSNQPAVACHDTTGWFIFNNGDIFTFNDPEYNVGNNYSTATGRFTAPVEGYYLITANIYFDTATGNYANAYYIAKNGSQYGPTGSASPWQQHNFGSGTGDETGGFTYVIGLSADDYIELKFGSQTRVYRKHSHMTVTLLH